MFLYIALGLRVIILILGVCIITGGIRDFINLDAPGMLHTLFILICGISLYIFIIPHLPLTYITNGDGISF